MIDVLWRRRLLLYGCCWRLYLNGGGLSSLRSVLFFPIVADLADALDDGLALAAHLTKLPIVVKVLLEALLNKLVELMDMVVFALHHHDRLVYVVPLLRVLAPVLLFVNRLRGSSSHCHSRLLSHFIMKFLRHVLALTTLCLALFAAAIAATAIVDIRHIFSCMVLILFFFLVT